MAAADPVDDPASSEDEDDWTADGPAQIDTIAPDDKTSVAGVTKVCLRTFKNIQAVGDDSETTKLVAFQNADNVARFRIWCGNIGAYHSVEDRRSADHRLREVPEVKNRIVELLSELVETNEDVYGIASGEQPNRVLEPEGGDSDGPNDAQADPTAEQRTEIVELALSVADIVTSLAKVSTLLQRATGRDRYLRARSAHGPSYLPEIDIRHIGDRFTKTREQPWLQDRLGRAIVQRRQYLKYSQRHHDRISHEPSNQQQDLAGEVEGAKTVLQSQSLPTTSVPDGTLAQTDASTYKMEMIDPVQIQSLDLEDTDENGGNAWEGKSLVSSKAEKAGDETLRVISLNDLSEDGEPFECPYCHGFVSFRKEHAWR